MEKHTLYGGWHNICMSILITPIKKNAWMKTDMPCLTINTSIDKQLEQTINLLDHYQIY